MGKRREKHPLEDNPFIEGFLEWMGSPEGQQHIDVSDTLWGLLEGVQLDARKRKLIWPDAERLSIDQSVRRIQKQHPEFPQENIERFLISWIEQYGPDSYSQGQLEELDRLADKWVDDYERQLTTGRKKPGRTRHS